VIRVHVRARAWLIVAVTLLPSCTHSSVIPPPTLPAQVVVPPGGCLRLPMPTGDDDTALINEWIASIPDGGCGSASPAGYDVEGTVLIEGRHDISLTLDGVLFRSSDLVGDLDPGPKTLWRSHVSILESSNIDITGLAIVGSSDCTYDEAFEGEAAFVLHEASNINLSDVSVNGVAGDGVEIAGAQDVTVGRSSFDCLGRMGISVVGPSSEVVVSDSRFDAVARSAFDIELTAEWYTADDIRFIDNSVGRHGLLMLAAGGLGSKDHVTVAGNRSTEQPIRIKYVGSHLTVRGNQGAGLAETPMVQATDGSGLTVDGNDQQFWPGAYKNPPSPAIELLDWCRADATGNSFRGAAALFAGAPQEPCKWTGGQIIARVSSGTPPKE